MCVVGCLLLRVLLVVAVCCLVFGVVRCLCFVDACCGLCVVCAVSALLQFFCALRVACWLVLVVVIRCLVVCWWLFVGWRVFCEVS